jgi:aryl sulfotransferase
MPVLLRAPIREYRTMAMDNHRWDRFAPRDDDIVIAVHPKCGSTWMQRIVDLLVFQSPDPRQFQATSPRLDATVHASADVVLAFLEAQTHRRFLNTELPFDSLPVFDQVKYIHVVRDGRDACWSLHNHVLGFRPEFQRRRAELAAQDPRFRVRFQDPPKDPRVFYLQWIAEAEAEETGYGIDLPFFEFETTYWRERMRENLLFVHYNDLKADLGGEMRRIADFLLIDTSESLMPKLVRAASFEAMKRQGEEMLPHLRLAFDHGAERFINKGFNGRWKDVLTEDDLKRYDALVRRKFTPVQGAWVAEGRAVGDPRSLDDRAVLPPAPNVP